MGPSAITYSAATSACDHDVAGKLGAALASTCDEGSDDADKGGFGVVALEPNAIANSAAISACEKVDGGPTLQCGSDMQQVRAWQNYPAGRPAASDECACRHDYDLDSMNNTSGACASVRRPAKLPQSISQVASAVPVQT